VALPTLLFFFSPDPQPERYTPEASNSHAMSTAKGQNFAKASKGLRCNFESLLDIFVYTNSYVDHAYWRGNMAA